MNDNTHVRVRVRNVVWKSHLKRISFTRGNRTQLLPRSACVAADETILRDELGHLRVRCRDDKTTKLWPIYFEPERIRIGSIDVELVAKEVTDEVEFESCNALENLHYRDAPIHGRTARIVIRSYHSLFPTVLGYVELATPFQMNKARSRVFDAPFDNCSIHWKKWNKESLTSNINLLVRVARVVVAPEFRGVGFAQLLMKHAIAFAKSRWQVAGLKPYFVEISADMLRYVPFAEKAGMILVGETEGNLHRVAKDMAYLLGRFNRIESKRNLQAERNFEASCGICDQQHARMMKSVEVMRDTGLTQGEFLDRLRRLDRDQVLKDFSLFRDIVSLPKPHFMMGLNDQAHEFICKRTVELNVAAPKSEQAARRRYKGIVRFTDVGIKYETDVRRTKSTHAIQQAFGISTDGFSNTVISGLNLDISPGEVVVVTGPSGSGKTSLVTALVRSADQQCSIHSGRIAIPKSVELGVFEKFRSTKPLIEAIGATDAGSAMRTLSSAGLAEAYLYLKRFDELSAGQQYRAMLAKLISKNRNLWVVDEFCSNLDPVTSNVVAHNIQKTARKLGVAVLVSTPDCLRFVDALKPDKVLLLRSSVEHLVMTGDQFIQQVANRHRIAFAVPRLRIPASSWERFKTKHDVTVFTEPDCAIDTAALWLTNGGNESVPASVASQDLISRKDLSARTARDAGFADLSALRRSISRRLGSELDRINQVRVTQFLFWNSSR